MDELIGRLAIKAGIDSAVAEKTVGIVLGFLRNEGPSDKVQALIDQIPGAEAAIAASSSNGGLSRLMGSGLMALGTDGFGRSDTRANLRRFFEVDAESTVIGTLFALAEKGQIERTVVAQAMKDLNYDANKVFPQLL